VKLIRDMEGYDHTAYLELPVFRDMALAFMSAR
jgi:hypothetical protein